MARHVCICLGRSENAVNSHWDTSNLLYVRYWIDSDAESHKIKQAQAAMTGNRSHWRSQITSAVRWNLETNSSWLIRGIWHFPYFSSSSQDWESPIRYPYLCSEPLIHHCHLLMSQWARQRTASSELAHLRSQILHRRWTGSRFMWPKKVHCVSISGRAAAWALRSKSQFSITDEGKSSTQSKYRRSRSPAQKYMRDLRYEWLSPSEVLPALSFNPCLYKCIYSVMNPPFQL